MRWLLLPLLLIAGAAQASLLFPLLSGSIQPVITITNRTSSDSDPAPGNAQAHYRLGADGLVYLTSADALVQVGAGSEWMFPPSTGDASGYEARATLTGGDVLDAGTVGSWVNLGTDQTWTQSMAIVGSESSTVLIEIRRAGSSDVLDSATITLTAELT